MRKMENSANTVTSGGLEGQGRAASMPKLNAEMQVCSFSCLICGNVSEYA